MARSKEKQMELDQMSDQEKFDRTSIEEFKKRWTFIKEHPEYWDSFYVTKNEYPHSDRWSEQMVIWWEECCLHISLFIVAIGLYPNHNITYHWDQYRSVKNRPHIHVYMPK